MSGKKFFFLFFSILFSGCGNFFSSRFQDVTAYFNTYYNAAQTYNRAVEKIEQAGEKERNPNRFVRMNISTDVQSQFDSVVEKCSKVIQFYPQSVFLDDAMLMIGNSYYYSGEYFRAERKYKEVRQNFPDGELFPLATLGLAKTYYQLKKYQVVNEVLGDSASLTQLNDNDVIAECFFLKGQIHFNAREFEKSTPHFVNALSFAEENLLKSQIAYQLGQAYELLLNYSDAAKTYEMLADESDDYIFEARGKIRYAVMLGKLNQNFLALELLEEMRDDRRNKDFFGQVDFEIGTILKENGDIDLAEEQFEYIDTTYRRTESSAKAQFQLADINEYIQKDFSLALQYYTKAKTEFLASEITDSARKKSEVLTRYFSITGNLVKFDSLINLKQHPELIGVMDSIKRFQQAKKDSIEKFHQDSVAAYVADSLKELGIEPSLSQSKVDESLIPKKEEDVSENETDSSDEIGTDIEDDLASDEQKIDSGKIGIAEKTPHQKREKTVWDEAEEEEMEEEKKSVQNTDSLLAVDSLAKDTVEIASGPAWLKDTIKTSLQDLFDSLARTQYEMGMLMNDKLHLRDSALYYFNLALMELPETEQTPKILYALSEFYLSQNDSDRIVADSLLRKIVDEFPRHTYANVARRALRMEVQDTVKIDSLEFAFSVAEQEYRAGNVQKAMNTLFRISSGDSTSPVVAKSLLAMGWIYENDLKQYDTALALYKILAQKFPATVYAASIKHKVAGADGKEMTYAGRKRFRTDPLQVNLTAQRISSSSFEPSGTDDVFDKLDSLPTGDDDEEPSKDEGDEEPLDEPDK
ncbi:MAG: tetratricopeptide repeat protein [Ignavibacteriales bacterium]|nr:tetratricopeptide repeat protein [Ignavibacteriales bacterium]